jgi:formate/nitrite transporter FocA (FNT family)
MFTFITSGYEHSIANMAGLLLGLLLPHGDGITWAGYWYNLGLATLGNVVGGAVLVAGFYWLGSPAVHAAPEVAPGTAGENGTPLTTPPPPAVIR